MAIAIDVKERRMNIINLEEEKKKKNAEKSVPVQVFPFVEVKRVPEQFKGSRH